MFRQPILVPGDAADRRRIDNLIGGQFLDMYRLSYQTHRRFGLLPSVQDIQNGHPAFPDVLTASRLLSPEVCGHATSYTQPVLLFCPPFKTRVELMKALSSKCRQSAKSCFGIYDKEFAQTWTDRYYRLFLADGALNTSETRYRNHLEWGMTGEAYSLLVMQSIQRGRLIDVDTLTMLDGENQVTYDDRDSYPKNYIPIGTCMPPPRLSPNDPPPPPTPSIEWIHEKILDFDRCQFRHLLCGELVEPSSKVT